MNQRYASFSLSLVIATAVVAQPTLTTTTHVPVVGQTVALKTATNFTWNGPSGADVEINYWDLFPSATGNRNFYYAAATSGFPTASLASTDGGSDSTFWSLTSEGLTVVGLRGTLEGALTYTDPVVELKLPLSFGGSWSDAGTANYVALGFPVTRLVSLTGAADGHGTLTLPNVSNTEVLRVKVRRRVTDNSALAVVTRIANITDYFSATSAHPLLKLTEDSTSTGMAWTVARSVEYIGDAALVGLDELDASDVVFTAFPNPATDRVTLDLSGDQRADQVELLDMQGRVVRTERVTSDVHVMNILGVAPGNYTIRTTLNGAALGVRSIVLQ